MERVALALLAAVVLAGCGGVLTGDAGLPTGEEARRGYESLDAVNATVEYRSLGIGSTSNMTVRIAQRPAEGMVRQRVVSPPDEAGDVTVSNGSVAWIYDASENEVTRISIGNASLSNTSTAEFVERIFGNLTESREEPTVAVSALPVVPSGGGDGTSALTTADLGGTARLNVTYLGTRTIADRRTYGVRIEPVNGSEGSRFGSLVENATYWFDAEYFYPLRAETAISVNGNLTRSVQVYRNVTFDPDLPSGVFEFEPPANATVQRSPRAGQTTFESVEAAAANVSFAVPEPSPPDGFELETAAVRRLDDRTVLSFTYSNGTHDFAVSIRRPPVDTEPRGDSVNVGGVDATATSIGDLTILRWRCGGSGYVVSGRVSRETLRRVARSMTSAC